MHQHHIDIGMDSLKRMPDGVLPLMSSRHHFCHFGKVMLRHDFLEAIVHLVLGNRQDDFIDDGRGLKHTQRMEHERLTAEGEKLFGNRAAHAKAPSGGRDQGDSASVHEQKLSYLSHRVELNPIHDGSFLSSRFTFNVSSWGLTTNLNMKPLAGCGRVLTNVAKDEA
jgi:hypothetical protein